MTTLQNLLQAYREEADNKWCRYYPNNYSNPRDFSKWCRGKAVDRLIDIEIAMQVRCKFESFK